MLVQSKTESKHTKRRGEFNRHSILQFLKLNDRWYSTVELSQILNISHQSVRSHCINLLNAGILCEITFYKHNEGDRISRRIFHYRVFQQSAFE